jgi:serine/threonine protein kinase
LLFQSPEQLNDEKATQKSDVWSLGVITYLLCAQCFPFNGSIMRLSKSVMNEDPPEISKDEFSESLRGLIKEMLIKNPKDRPSIREILTR